MDANLFYSKKSSRTQAPIKHCGFEADEIGQRLAEYSDSDLFDSDDDPTYVADTSQNSDSDNDQGNVPIVEITKKIAENEASSHGTGNSSRNRNVEPEYDTEDERTPASRRRKRNPERHKRNVRKNLCSKGEEHVASAGKIKKKREPQLIDCSRCRYKCQESFSRMERDIICSEYWKLGDYNRQKDFILSHSKIVEKKRETVKLEKRMKNRNVSIQFVFNINENDQRVCKEFFLKTLNISNSALKSAIKGCGQSGVFTGQDRRGKNESSNKTREESVKEVKSHIEKFPVIESHYSRKDSRRKYLDKNLSISQMYRLYYAESGKQTDPPLNPVKENIYRKIFCDYYNYSFFKPKKDQCVKCLTFEKMNKEEKESDRLKYQEHIKMKNEVRDKKNEDKSRAERDSTFVSASFDLQSVLQIPQCNASLLYYSRKISVYNYSFKNDAWCYCWNEMAGKRGSNDIGTAVYTWLIGLPENVKEVSLFSDACGGQNRNQNMCIMLLMALQNSAIEIITHNFFETGHSQMECDSIHAAIEREKKYTEVYSMLDWISIFRRARRKLRYNVKQMQYTDFYDFQLLAKVFMKNRKKNEVGEIVNWLRIKSFRYIKKETNCIFYRYNFTEDFKKLIIYKENRQSQLPTNASKAYSNPIPISAAKKADLITLCDKSIIPQELHQWFKSLPSSRMAADQLPGPAHEDSGDSDDDN